MRILYKRYTPQNLFSLPNKKPQSIYCSTIFCWPSTVSSQGLHVIGDRWHRSRLLIQKSFTLKSGPKIMASLEVRTYEVSVLKIPISN